MRTPQIIFLAKRLQERYAFKNCPPLFRKHNEFYKMQSGGYKAGKPIVPIVVERRSLDTEEGT